MRSIRCIRGDQPAEYTIRMGSSYHDRDGLVLDVRRFIIHPYHRGHDYDLGLLELAQPISRYGDRVQPVILPDHSNRIMIGDLLTATGWGQTCSPGDDESVLRSVTVPAYNQQLCRQNYATERLQITASMLCAGYGNGGKDTCQGDSGGPLVDGNRELVGIVSFGYKCAQSHFPGVYARVTAGLDWILDIART